MSDIQKSLDQAAWRQYASAAITAIIQIGVTYTTEEDVALAAEFADALLRAEKKRFPNITK